VFCKGTGEDRIIYGKFSEASIHGLPVFDNFVYLKKSHVDYNAGIDGMNEIILLYITNPNREHAEKISKHLIEKRLAACTNVFPINSMYHWKGDVENDAEYVCIAKTTPARADDVEKAVAETHEYEVPCILRIPVHANESYYKWIREEVKNAC